MWGTAEGRPPFDAQMIFNHKDAIEFLVANADDIGFNRYTILNLHALLVNNLLPDPAAIDRLRHIIIGIDSSAFHPLEVAMRSGWLSAVCRETKAPRRRSVARDGK